MQDASHAVTFDMIHSASLTKLNVPISSMQVTLSNLDLIIQESRAQFEQLLPHVLDDLQLQWSHCFPRATGAIAAAG